MNILILGSGGREHALAWRLSKDSSCTSVFVWPGNDGMEEGKIKTVDVHFDKATFKSFIEQQSVSFVIPGSEKFLYEGVIDWCRELGLVAFGPSREAARLEQSKLFAKDLMQSAGVPTAKYHDLTNLFAQDVNAAVLALKEFRSPVIKISGPSLGKGVFVCESPEEASEVLVKLHESSQPGMEDGLFVEERVEGKEVSMFFACSGTTSTYLGSAQDHKRVFDGDKGPNTGGMGAISPVPWVDQAFIESINRKFVLPTLQQMKEKGTPFLGVLFLGLMVNSKEVNLLEYNVRFGDPETQVILPLLDGDFGQFLYAFSKGEATEVPTIKPEAAVHVVKAASGYPGVFGAPIEKGKVITGNRDEGLSGKIFFAGVKKVNGQLVTNGGRVLGMTAWSPTAREAIANCYSLLNEAHFSGEHFRSDIGKNL